MNPVTERFVELLDPRQRDENVYYRATNMTDAILVVDEESDASSLVEACFESRFPVAVSRVRHDPSVPRIEFSTEEDRVGETAIREFLAHRALTL
jgi:hypothetical protein